MPSSSLYGSGLYGAGIYGGQPSNSVYILSSVYLAPTITESKYIQSTALIQGVSKQYIQSTAFLEAHKAKYLLSSVSLWQKSNYIASRAFVQTTSYSYIASKILLTVELLQYEVDEFQVIVDKQYVKFYWKDTSPGIGKTYTIYDSSDSGTTWNTINSTTSTEYQLNSIPFDIPSRIYKITITSGSRVSYGFLSYPTFSFRKVLNALDNGYWDTDPNSNVYKIHQGITKETSTRAELEISYTRQDESILRIRNSRISDVYGVAFDQQSSTIDEDYRRKIWNLFEGFRNSLTYTGAYDATKAFTHIPPRIKKLSQDGWILGRRYLGKDTIPLSNLTALYGVKFEVHLYKLASGGVSTTADSTTTFDATSISGDSFNQLTNYYKNKYLVFNTGNNAYKSRRIASYSAITSSVSRFVTDPFVSNSTSGDTFFVSEASTDVIEKYIKEVIPLHSSAIFLYFSDYATENQSTGFTGTLSNIEKIPSSRLRVLNINNTVDDEGKNVQAVYESGVTLSSVYPLSSFGGNGVVCWDSILWGESPADFRLYVSYASDLMAPNWTYQSGVTQYVQLNGLQDVSLVEYIKTNSEVVAAADTTGFNYIRNVDYVMDYRNGTIRRAVNSGIPTGQIVSVRYDSEWGQMAQNQSLDFGAGRNYFKYKFTINGLSDRDDFEFSGFYIKKLAP